MMKSWITFLAWCCWCLPLPAQTFGRQEQVPLLELQAFINDLTLLVNQNTFANSPEKIAAFTAKYQKIAFPSFLVRLQKPVNTLLASAKNNAVDSFRVQQIHVSEQIYWVYLGLNHQKKLENAYHHAEAEMAHALMQAYRGLHLCDSEGNQAFELDQIQAIPYSPLPQEVGKVHEAFWEAWKAYKTLPATASYQKRLDFYNHTLVQKFNTFIDLAGKEGEYMPYQPYAVKCPQAEASAGAKEE